MLLSLEKGLPMDKEFNFKKFVNKLFSPEPLYLNRAEKEYVSWILLENQDYERILDVLDERKYRKLYLKEQREQRKGLLYPDSDEIYQKYFNQKNEIEELRANCLYKDSIILDLHKKIMELTPEA